MKDLRKLFKFIAIMKNAKKPFSKGIKSPILFFIIIFIIFSGCFSSWQGNEGTLIINLGGTNARAALWPPQEYGIINNLEYKISLSNNGNILNFEANGGDKIKVSVPIGRWNIKVNAYYKGKHFAKGEVTENINAGNNMVIIKMNELDSFCYDCEITIEKYPTCIENGLRITMCSHDSHYKEEIIDALGHEMVATENISIYPTCIATGMGELACTRDNCNHTEAFGEIPALGHDWGNWGITTNSTCTTEGVETRTCTNDNAHYETRSISKPDHNWGSWELTIPAGFLKEGLETKKCIDCQITGTRTIQAESVEVVWIKPGTFTMGSQTSEPGRYSTTDIFSGNSIRKYEEQFQVTLSKGFYMSKYVVTQEQYLTVMGINPSSHTTALTGESVSRLPVEMVSWFDTIEFCNKLSEREGLTPVYTMTDRTPATGHPITASTVTANWNASGYRLPTEAEWEYACRAETITAFYWGSNYINTAQANYNGTAIDANNTTAGTNVGRTREVGKYEPNPWGLYDMIGNVWEFCWDLYGNYPSISQIDFSGASEGTHRTLRGGSFDNGGRDVRTACRSIGAPNTARHNHSFRVVRN